MAAAGPSPGALCRRLLLGTLTMRAHCMSRRPPRLLGSWSASGSCFPWQRGEVKDQRLVCQAVSVHTLCLYPPSPHRRFKLMDRGGWGRKTTSGGLDTWLHGLHRWSYLHFSILPWGKNFRPWCLLICPEKRQDVQGSIKCV